jgi:hypothetical protein
MEVDLSMGIQLTANQVVAMAPDSSSASAGKKLANVKHWKNLGIDEQVVWGECQGSALYQVRVALATFTLHCSCPSRKQPCKHGLGLLLLVANQPDSFTSPDQPDWVREWLAKQASTAKRKETLEENKAAGKVSATSAKTAEKRRRQVVVGVEHLNHWLNDLVRNGVGTLETQPETFWENQAARMVDNQAPGLAARLRRLAALPNAGPLWPEKVVAQLGSLALLTEAFQRMDQFAPEFQEEIRQMIGWTVKEDDVIVSGEHVIDDWLFLGQLVEVTDRGKNQRTWLLGQESGRVACLLQFSYAGTPFSAIYPLGSRQRATLVFYPGIQPQRALVYQRHGDAQPLCDQLPGYESYAAFFVAVTETLAHFPWRERFLCVLRGATPHVDVEQGQWWLYDQHHQALPLQKGEHWQLLVLSGGYPVDVACEWNGEVLTPLGVLVDKVYHILVEGEAA